MTRTTPSQTVGPFLTLGLPEVAPGGDLLIRGRVTDGAGEPVPDAMVETWQADPAGRFDHPDDPRGPVGGFHGFGRCWTDSAGEWWIRTVKPGPLPSPDGAADEAPHLDVSVLARGLLHRVVTRIYFPDETDANAADPVLAGLPPDRRSTLIANQADDGLWFDIRLQGDHETVFFTV